jgi:hypothetical protein
MRNRAVEVPSSVKKGGALRSSDATIAVAHNIEVKMLTALVEFILALSRIAICRVESFRFDSIT